MPESPPTGSSDLTDRLGALTRERTAFLGVLDGMDEAARSARPAPGAWSPVEIGEHLYRVEATMLGGIERQLAAGDARKDLGPASRAAVVLLLAAMRTPKKMRVPEGARGVVPEGMPYEALREAWPALEGRWAAAAASLPAALEGTPLIRHPLAGPLTFGDGVRFLVAHASRHRRQLTRPTPR